MQIDVWLRSEGVRKSVDWPDGWPVPRVGELVQMPDTYQGRVVDVTWFLPTDAGVSASVGLALT